MSKMHRHIGFAIRVTFSTIALLLFTQALPANAGWDLPWLRSSEPSRSVARVGMNAKIGVFLPLTGKYSRIGKDVQNALEMAMFDNEAGNLNLQFFDTESSPERAAALATEAINQGINIVVGPVTSAETKAAAAVLKPYGIPVLSLSNDITIADAHTLIFGLVPEMSLQESLDYAQNNGIYLGYAVLTENALADTLSRALQVHAQNNRYSMPQIARFTDVSAALNQLLTDVNTSYLSTPGPGRLGGLIVPESGYTTQTIFKRLSRMDTQGVVYRVIGSSLWMDQPPLMTEAEGAFFAALSPALTDAFNERYRQLYNKTPHQAAMVAYDAMQLLIYYAQNGSVTDLTAQGMLSADEFIGTMGTYKFCPSGAVVRGLTILGISGSRVVELQPAPESVRKFANDYCEF